MSENLRPEGLHVMLSCRRCNTQSTPREDNTVVGLFTSPLHARFSIASMTCMLYQRSSHFFLPKQVLEAIIAKYNVTHYRREFADEAICDIYWQRLGSSYEQQVESFRNLLENHTEEPWT